MITQVLKMAWKSIIGNKMRSLLTMIGIVIGVVTITVLLSLVDGVTRGVLTELDAIGTNFFSASIKNLSYPISLNELEDFKAHSTYIADISTTEMAGTDIHYNNFSETTTVSGVTSGFGRILKQRLACGRNIKRVDVQNNSNVIVLRFSVAEKLFGVAEKALGNQVIINGQKLKVIGVLEKDLGILFAGDTFIPYTYFCDLFQQGQITYIAASACSAEHMDNAINEMEHILNNYFYGDEEAFSVYNQTSNVDTVNQVLIILKILFGGIATISLVVGGIGIMNIMLVTVSERTREIGIRKAIGASRFSILMQFLFESVMLCLFGALIGVLLSVGIVSILGIIGASYGLSFTISISMMGTSVLFALGVGVAFGVSPANKASKLQPISALRHE